VAEPESHENGAKETARHHRAQTVEQSTQRGGNVSQSSDTRLAGVLSDRKQQPKVATTGPLCTKTAAAMGTVTERGTRALGRTGVRAVAGTKRTGILLPRGTVRRESLNVPSEGCRRAGCGKIARPVRGGRGWKPGTGEILRHSQRKRRETGLSPLNPWRHSLTLRADAATRPQDRCHFGISMH